MMWIAVGVLVYLAIGCFLAWLGEAFQVGQVEGLVVVALWPVVLALGFGRYVAWRAGTFLKAQENGE